MKEPKTNVIFRKTDDNEVIAFFPDTLGEDGFGLLTSYMHCGQHSYASLAFYRECKPCAEAEYRELYDELTNLVGYNLSVKRRFPRKMA